MKDITKFIYQQLNEKSNIVKFDKNMNIVMLVFIMGMT